MIASHLVLFSALMTVLLAAGAQLAIACAGMFHSSVDRAKRRRASAVMIAGVPIVFLSTLAIGLLAEAGHEGALVHVPMVVALAAVYWGLARTLRLRRNEP